jgi:hypothetical protein
VICLLSESKRLLDNKIKYVIEQRIIDGVASPCAPLCVAIARDLQMGAELDNYRLLLPPSDISDNQVIPSSTPLMLASKVGKMSIVRLVLTKFSSTPQHIGTPQADGTTTLMWAVKLLQSSSSTATYRWKPHK